MSWFHFNLQDFSISFLSILFEGVPFMFIGTLLSGIIDAFVPAERMERRAAAQHCCGHRVRCGARDDLPDVRGRRGAGDPPDDPEGAAGLVRGSRICSPRRLLIRSWR